MNKEIKKIVEIIKQHQKIAFFHHTRPDGDAISSSYALALCIKRKYPQKTVKWFWDKKSINDRFSYLNFDDEIICENDDLLDNSWLSIIGDVSEQKRTYKGHLITDKRIVFDHHNCNINHEKPALVYYSIPGLPASAIQSAEIALELDPNLDSQTATMLYFGIVTDTANYKHCDNDISAFNMAIRLLPKIKNGALTKIYAEMSKKSIGEIKIESWIMSNFNIKGNLATCIIPKSIQKEFDVSSDACSKPNLLSVLPNVNIWALFIEYKDDWRCEYRSNIKGKRVDVFAKSVGGGGHTHASGSSAQNLNKVKNNIAKLFEYVNQ